MFVRRDRAWAARAVLVAAATSVVVVPAVTGTSAGAAANRAPDDVRAHYAGELGLRDVGGVTVDPERGVLLVASATMDDVVAFDRSGDTAGETALPGAAATTMTVDRGRGRITAVRAGELADAPTGRRGGAGGKPLAVALDQVVAAEQVGTRWYGLLANGTKLVVLDDTPDLATQPVTTINLAPLTKGPVVAIAPHPTDGSVYLLGKRAVARMAPDGTVTQELSLDAAALTDPVDAVLAPTADLTDAATEQSLFVADAGTSPQTSRLVEIDLAPLALPTADVQAALVRTVDLSAVSPPSPDPAGITLQPGTNRLIISDSEVDEMPIYQGANLFVTSLNGALVNTGTTVPFTPEPTGAGYMPYAGALLLSDDDANEIYLNRTGTDGLHGTADDAVSSFDTAGFLAQDAEDVTFDTARDVIYIVDGVNTEVYRVAPNANGFNGQAPAGDDTVTSFDIGIYGALDPEGITYDPVTDHLFVLDQKTVIYELTVTGALVRTIGFSSANSLVAAGIAIAPASSGSGRSFYVVDRGLDNDVVPDENDGKLYELTFPIATTNVPPTVNAGADRSTTEGSTIVLGGTVTDDTATTATWTQRSGPAAVTFANAASPASEAVFPAIGSYELRLTATDGSLTAFDDVVVTVTDANGVVALERAVQAITDDAEEDPAGIVRNGGGNLEFGQVGTTTLTNQTLGVRFAGVAIPKGATVQSAAIQFTASSAGSGATSVVVVGDDLDNAATYPGQTAPPFGITSRPDTTATVSWTVPPWAAAGDAGPAQLSPNLAAIVQEIIDRPNWATGNAVAFSFTGTGVRQSRARDNALGGAPVLRISYTTAPPPPVNQAPVANAGPDQSTPLAGSVTLNGSATDDGLPAPPAALTAAWTTVSGPGTVTFGSPGALVTTASFSAGGTYVLRLTVSDSVLVDADDVTVTVVAPVNTAPVVSAGPDLTVVLPGAATLNGTTTDDGLPSNTLTRSWSVVSSPRRSRVTFANAGSATTTATFSAAGSYVLRLTASDGALSSSDTVTVTVVTNVAPVVNAGADQTITFPSSASLVGTVTDDGIPQPSTITQSWSKVSGPGTVTFSAPTERTTTASFSVSGTYVLRLTASDGLLSRSDDIQVTVRSNVPQTVAFTLSGSTNDAEQLVSSGAMNRTDVSLELGAGTGAQLVGLRFANLAIPRGATVSDAYIQFTAASGSTTTAALTLKVENVDNASAYGSAKNEISKRTLNAASVPWAPPAWTTGAAGAEQRTPSIASLVQAVVNRTGWTPGNSMGFVVSGTGTRAARSADALTGTAVLYVTYTG